VGKIVLQRYVQSSDVGTGLASRNELLDHARSMRDFARL
jgi:hypothetical protein